MSNSIFNTLSDAYRSKSPLTAVVRVRDEKRVRIGTVDRLVHDVFRRNGGYVTFALLDGTYRTAKLSDVETVLAS